VASSPAPMVMVAAMWSPVRCGQASAAGGTALGEAMRTVETLRPCPADVDLLDS